MTNDGDPQPPMEGVSRRSLIPPSDGVRLPSGRMAQDPADFHIPTGENATVVLDAVAPDDETASVDHRASPSAPIGAASISVESRASRPAWRRSRVVWMGSAAGALIIAAGVVWAASREGGPIATPPSATVSPTPSASPVPDDEMWGLLDDGIAEDEYPKDSAIRGKGYPLALSMEDWVWDRIGPGWTLFSVSAQPWSESPGPAEMYLASPEGVVFDLVEVRIPGAIGVKVMTWHEEDKEAFVVYNDSEGNSASALVDLVTGNTTPLVFKMASGSSHNVEFLGGAADGAELWGAWNSDYTEYRAFRWTPQDDWKRVMPESDYFGASYVPRSPSGEVALFEVWGSDASGLASSRSGQPGHPRYIWYDIGDGSSTLVKPLYPADGSYCYPAQWIDDDHVFVVCYIGDTDSEWTGAVTRTGSTTTARRGDVYPPDLSRLDQFDDPFTRLRLSSEDGDYAVFSVASRVDGEYVTVLEAGAELPQGGVSFAGARMVAPGVARFNGYEGTYLVDTENGIGSVLVSVTSRDLVASWVGFGEAARPDVVATTYD